ncbi:hypothetical protein NQ176_g9979 [Zarea fungicola]|uniref:Uncharacterized protein n=1 Tax=Zarea fungicola TaxID=93591 RepID=A0ACC1MJ97_9HYPO|nr:hypothetical protein NQ176_g9979 [Lecanicillium fungicola]
MSPLNKLIETVAKANLPGLDPKSVLAIGATQVRSTFKGDELAVVLSAYNTAITNCFYVAVAMSVLALVGAVFVPWNSVKGKKIEMAAA